MLKIKWSIKIGSYFQVEDTQAERIKNNQGFKIKYLPPFHILHFPSRKKAQFKCSGNEFPTKYAPPRRTAWYFYSTPE